MAVACRPPVPAAGLCVLGSPCIHCAALQRTARSMVHTCECRTHLACHHARAADPRASCRSLRCSSRTTAATLLSLPLPALPPQTLSSKLGPTIQQQQEELLQQMAAQLARLEAGLALLGQPGQGAEGQRPPERTISWFRASCYPLYKQVADAIELQQPGQPAQQLAQLRSCLAVVESVARGSDLHVLLAVKHAAKARLVHGGESAECRAADLAMGQAHVARCAAGGTECARRTRKLLLLLLLRRLLALMVTASLLEHPCCSETC